MFLRTCMVSISSSKQMSHCVPPFDVGNATILVSRATSPINQSSSDRLLLRDSSLPLRERMRLQHRTQRGPETETQEIQVQLLTLPGSCCDITVITYSFCASIPFPFTWAAIARLAGVWRAVIEHLKTLDATFSGVKEKSTMIPRGFDICKTSCRNQKRTWNNLSSVIVLQLLLASLCCLAQLPEFAWDKKGLEKNDEKQRGWRKSFLTLACEAKKSSKGSGSCCVLRSMCVP